MEVMDDGLELDDPPGATPLDAQDLEGLIPGHISTRAELNAWEQANILRAMERLRRRRSREVLDDVFLRKLHTWMFGDTWRWAGEYRRRETNIGIDPVQIPVQVRQLCENFRHQRDMKVFTPLELAVRFHRGLVWIHPFPNGNGRHTRLAADLLVESLGASPLSWGGGDIDAVGELRDEYLAALRAADAGNHAPLIAFAAR